MFTSFTPNNNLLIFPSDAVKSVAEMFIEHYDKMFNKSVIAINIGDMSIKQWLNDNGFGEYKYILYNLEHKWPAGYVLNSKWRNIFDFIIDQVDMVLDFQIEDYIYFKTIGFENKFRFFPLRYTGWFEQFINKNIQKDYELQFEGVIDTNTRRDILSVLAGIPCYGAEVLDQINLLVTNTFDQTLKFNEKQRCKFCLDAPHYDYGETINTLRIFENLCLNCPTIVYDKYGESMNYFGDLIFTIKHDDFTTYNLKKLIMNTEPNKPASGFKLLTYNDSNFKDYQKDLLQEFTTKYGIQIPRDVLEINF